MSLIAINPDRIITYVPLTCRKLEGDVPSFLLRPIPACEMAEIEDLFMERVTIDGAEKSAELAMRFHKGRQKVRILRAGLRGWRGFKMPSASDATVLVEAPFAVGPDGAPTEHTLSMLPPDLRLELANAITEIQHLSEDALGK